MRSSTVYKSRHKQNDLLNDELFIISLWHLSFQALLKWRLSK